MATRSSRSSAREISSLPAHRQNALALPDPTCVHQHRAARPVQTATTLILTLTFATATRPRWRWTSRPSVCTSRAPRPRTMESSCRSTSPSTAALIRWTPGSSTPARTAPRTGSTSSTRESCPSCWRFRRSSGHRSASRSIGFIRTSLGSRGRWRAQPGPVSNLHRRTPRLHHRSRDRGTPVPDPVRR